MFHQNLTFSHVSCSLNVCLMRETVSGRGTWRSGFILLPQLSFFLPSYYVPGCYNVLDLTMIKPHVFCLRQMLPNGLMELVWKRFIALHNRLTHKAFWITRSQPSFWCSNFFYYKAGTFMLTLIPLNILAVSV